jgi:hypothetical protein
MFGFSKNLAPSVARKPNTRDDERDAVVERLRDFLRLDYMTGAEVARRIGTGADTLYSWLKGKSKPNSSEKISAFLDSLPAESSSGIAPVGYEYREYKNWRGIGVGIPKPRWCLFCKGAKGAIRKARGGFQGICPDCGATGPRRESHDEAVRAWNGKS